jgi:SAM-dependent methyltransferase
MNTGQRSQDKAADEVGSMVDHWALASEAWTRERERIAVMTRDATQALLETLAPEPQERLLDLACGPGDPSLQLAHRVGPSGCIVSLDVVLPMLTCLSAVAEELQLAQIRTVCAAADTLPLAAETFDGVSCRFGAMFFPSVDRAASEALRVLRPGGRLVFAVWGDDDASPYFRLVGQALDDVGAPSFDPPPDAPDVFALAEPGRLDNSLERAGFSDVRSCAVSMFMRLPGTRPDELLDVQRDISASLRLRTATLDEATLERARNKVAATVAEYADPDGLRIPGQIRVVQGRKPGSRKPGG